MAGEGLVLRDIHLPVAPSWWPPAPGWWAVAALVLFAVLVLYWRSWRRRRRRRALARMFDAAVSAADTPGARIAAVSELLRRAARGRDPTAAALQGRAWLEFLDRDVRTPAFNGALGQLLLDGGFRRHVEETHVAALCQAARVRFLEWAGGRG